MLRNRKAIVLAVKKPINLHNSLSELFVHMYDNFDIQ